MYAGCQACLTRVVGRLGEEEEVVELLHLREFGAMGDVVEDTRAVLRARARHGGELPRERAQRFLRMLGDPSSTPEGG